MDIVRLIIEIISSVIIPAIALYFAAKGIKTWQLDKITNIYSNIKCELEKILQYNYNYNGNEYDINALYVGLLDELEILAIFIDRKYLLLNRQLREQIFDDYIKYIYENKITQEIIEKKRKYKSGAYINFEKLYKKWNKK